MYWKIGWIIPKYSISRLSRSPVKINTTVLPLNVSTLLLIVEQPLVIIFFSRLKGEFLSSITDRAGRALIRISSTRGSPHDPSISSGENRMKVSPTIPSII